MPSALTDTGRPSCVHNWVASDRIEVQPKAIDRTQDPLAGKQSIIRDSISKDETGFDILDNAP